MPFASVNDLPPNPDVRIFFTGLLILDQNPADDPQPGVNTCEVFVHRSAPDHRLTIEVRRKRVGKPDIIMMRHVGQLDFITPSEQGVPPRFGMDILVNNTRPDPDHPSPPQGVRRYNPDDPENTSSEGAGFGLVIDLDNLTSIGPVSEPGGRPSILINDAVFYTAAKNDPSLVVSLKKNGQVVVPRLPPFASVIGANIYLRANEQVTLSWVRQGLLQSLNLPKVTEEGLSYEIYIVNEPLYETEANLLPPHDELKEYFKILPEAQDKFELEVAPPQPGQPPAPRGSSVTPCMPVTTGGTGTP
jgi:hypothetical protein